jgi:hypothetical protein
MEQFSIAMRSSCRTEDAYGPWRRDAELTLTSDERETLERWAGRPTTAQALAQRARMILACADGQPNQHVARLERVTRQAVGHWHARFVKHRLDGLLDEPRPGARVVRWTLETKPRAATHWSTRARCCSSQVCSCSR